MKRQLWQTVFLAALILSLDKPTDGQTSGAVPVGKAIIEAVLTTHHAWRTPPVSIEISGVSTRGKTTEPVKIVATRFEEASIEYGGTSRIVATPESHFQEVG